LLIMGKYLRYRWFERGIGYVLLAGMAVVILLATWSFLWALVGPVRDGGSGLEYAAFQQLFDKVLAAVIALELAHSVQQIAAGKHGLIQVRTVVLIGVLAVVRKLIVIDVDSTSGAFLAGLAAAVVALGSIYALIVWIETRVMEDEVGGVRTLEKAPGPGSPQE
jgi:uncharacterized membrane protein (DUF373 family)